MSGAALSGADLSVADFTNANLRFANLREANLGAANLLATVLEGADLRDANLAHANLTSTHMANADLSRANLIGSKVHGADLRGARFDLSLVWGTVFTSLDLSMVIGLDRVVHDGPSAIGLDTLYHSKGEIPEIFLRGCGLSDADIEYAKLSKPDLSNEEVTTIGYRVIELRATQPIQINRLFISHSSRDSEFVDRIEGDLKAKGVRFWRDIHDAVAGRLETQIDRAIRQNPTFLLVLSERSVESDWVEHEVRKARELEKEIRRDVICPVALDESWKTCRWPARLREQIQEYNILDFSNWHNDDFFARQFNKLIEGLHIFYQDDRPD